MMRSLNRKRRGVVLIELVIVLGIMGLIAAAIWAASTVVREREEIHDTVQLISDIAARVRNTYTGFPNANVPVDVDDQIAANLYPESVVDSAGTGTTNVWGGTFYVRFPAAAPYNGFSIEVTLSASQPETASRTTCLGLLTRLEAMGTDYDENNTSDTLPTDTVRLDPTQGTGPSLAFVRIGNSWAHVTGESVGEISTRLGSASCTGVAFYYRL